LGFSKQTLSLKKSAKTNLKMLQNKPQKIKGAKALHHFYSAAIAVAPLLHSLNSDRRSAAISKVAVA